MRTVAKRIQRLREIGQTIGQIAGGDCIHPRNTRVGGMYRNCSEQAKIKMYDLAKEGLPLAKAQMDFMIAILRNYQARESVNVGGMKVPLPKTLGYHNQGYLATHAFYGSSSLDECPTWDIDRFKEVRPWDWYMGEMEVSLEEPRYPVGGTTKSAPRLTPRWKPAPESRCTTASLLKSARVHVSQSTKATMRKARSAKTLPVRWSYTDSLYEMIDCIDALDTNGKVIADYIPDGDGSLGWASNEAPRGTDVHIARVKDWKVEVLQHARPDNLELCDLQCRPHRRAMAAC